MSCRDVFRAGQVFAISAQLQFPAVLSRAVEAQVMRLTRGERRCLDRHVVLPTNEDEMKKTLLVSAAAVAGYAAGLFAQQAPAPRPTAEPAHNVFVLSGCLRAGAEATPTFKLTDASFIGQPAPGRAADAGAVGTSGQKASYELRPVSGLSAQGLDANALKAHSGQQVEVVVRPVESLAPAPATDLAESQAAKPTAPAPERFSVTEIKRVIGTCP